jgi:hypothetical protein
MAYRFLVDLGTRLPLISEDPFYLLISILGPMAALSIKSVGGYSDGVTVFAHFLGSDEFRLRSG